MIELYEGDCLEVIQQIPAASVDCVITDPPYPEIDRDYGRMTEAAWFAMMQALIPEVRRVLKPTGSAVFILQPNSEKIGRMRLWLWKFMVWVGEEWGIVQDAYWWNTSALPVGGAITDGLLRGSVKACIWMGAPNCYRKQEAVLWKESRANTYNRTIHHAGEVSSASGLSVDRKRIAAAAVERGGVTPFNILPFGQSGQGDNAASHGHGAGTPYALADWWTRYICPTGGTVLDCFAGSGTMGLAALRNGCDFIGIEKMPKYYEIMRQRVEAEEAKPRTLRMELSI